MPCLELATSIPKNASKFAKIFGVKMLQELLQSGDAFRVISSNCYIIHIGHK